MSLDGIIGHNDVVKTLRTVLEEDRTGHAYLFSGPAGVGKKTLTRAFAAALLCPVKKSAGNCECYSCRRFHQGLHPDFHCVLPTGNSIKIEQMRELQRSCFLRPLLGNRKVFFFPEAEQLTEAAANSFLKLLEEPPASVVFLFNAVRDDYLLPTIRSRCQNFHLFPLSAAETELIHQQKGIITAPGEDGGQSRVLPGEASTHPKLADILGLDFLSQLKTTAQLEKMDRKECLAVIREWETEARLHLKEPAAESTTRDSRLRRLIFVLEELGRIALMVENNTNQRLALDTFLLAVRLFR